MATFAEFCKMKRTPNKTKPPSVKQLERQIETSPARQVSNHNDSSVK